MVCRRPLALAALAAAVMALSQSPPARAKIDLAEFDKEPTERQSQVLSAVLLAYYDHYKKNPNTRHIAQCMADLYVPPAEGLAPRLFTLIFNDLDRARLDTQRTYSIEGIVQGVIEQNCGTP